MSASGRIPSADALRYSCPDSACIDPQGNVVGSDACDACVSCSTTLSRTGRHTASSDYCSAMAIIRSKAEGARQLARSLCFYACFKGSQPHAPMLRT